MFDFIGTYKINIKTILYSGISNVQYWTILVYKGTVCLACKQ